MSFTGTWYKNGPIRIKERHPFVGTGNIVKFKFRNGKLYELNQKQVSLPFHQKCLPQIDKTGIAFRNEGNISVQYFKDELYAMSEFMPPYVLDPESLDTKGIKPAFPSGVHAKVIDDVIWNCYMYGNYMVITKNFNIYKTIFIDCTYYLHDFFINSECMICAIHPYEYDFMKSPLEGIGFSGSTQLFVYYFKEDVHIIYPFPESVKDHIVTHMNVTFHKEEKRIQCFGIPKNDFSFSDIRDNTDYISLPFELSFKYGIVTLRQHWFFVKGDMPVKNDKYIAFVNKKTLYLWNPNTITISQFNFKNLIEEPVWTETNHLLVIEHGYDTMIHTFDETLQLLSSQAIPKVNMSFHGLWKT